MVLFAANTGARDNNVCGLEWAWEQSVETIGRSVFVIPPEVFKSSRAHVVVLNDAAWSVIQAQRGLHQRWVFPHRCGRIETMNNTGWQAARKRAELPGVRIHDIRHTFATRLRAAGVAREDRDLLLGHEGRGMPEHYASADIGRLVQLANRVLDRVETRAVLRVVNG